MDAYDYQAVVFDIGSGMAKVGFAGDDAPKKQFPSVLVRHTYRTQSPPFFQS